MTNDVTLQELTATVSEKLVDTLSIFGTAQVDTKDLGDMMLIRVTEPCGYITETTIRRVMAAVEPYISSGTAWLGIECEENMPIISIGLKLAEA